MFHHFISFGKSVCKKLSHMPPILPYHKQSHRGITYDYSTPSSADVESEWIHSYIPLIHLRGVDG